MTYNKEKKNIRLTLKIYGSSSTFNRLILDGESEDLLFFLKKAYTSRNESKVENINYRILLSYVSTIQFIDLHNSRMTKSIINKLLTSYATCYFSLK